MRAEKRCSLGVPSRPVVGHDDDERVVQPSEVVQEVQQPADLRVGVGEEARVHLVHAGEHPPLAGAERVPFGIHGGRSGSTVPSGTTPDATCRAKTSSRQRSHPWSNRPRYGSDHSGATWCGECIAVTWKRL